MFGSNSGFTFSQIVTAAIALFILPLTTRLMNSEEFGAFARLMAFTLFISIGVRMGANQALLVLLNKSRTDEEIVTKYNSAIITTLLMGGLMTLIVLFLRLMNVIESWYFFALPFALIEALNALKLTYYRYSNNSNLYLLQTLLSQLLVVLFVATLVYLFPLAEIRLSAMTLAYLIVHIVFLKKTPKFSGVSLSNIKPYVQFGGWLAMQWLINEFINWFLIEEIAAISGNVSSGRWSILKTLFYTLPGLCIVTFELIFIDVFYKIEVKEFKSRSKKFSILLLLALTVYSVLSYFFDEYLLLIVSGNSEFIRVDYWSIYLLLAVYLRFFMFIPLYSLYKAEKTFFVFISYLISYSLPVLLYYFLSTDPALWLFVVPFVLLNITLRIFDVKNKLSV